MLAPKDGADFPVVFSSKDKHASYVDLNTCKSFTSCFDTCEIAATSDAPPMVNAGEQGAPLVTNLSTQGFINEVNGWTEAELYNGDPWDTTKDFGGAGNIAEDLVDPAFVTPACP